MVILISCYLIHVFQAIEHESVNFVKNSIAQLIGVIVKHELPTNSWPEIIHYVQRLITNDRLEDKEVSKKILKNNLISTFLQSDIKCLFNIMFVIIQSRKVQFNLEIYIKKARVHYFMI